MKDKIYAVIVKHLLPSTGGQDCASELADMMQKFVEWVISHREMQTRMSVDDLFNYWYKEIYGK